MCELTHLQNEKVDLLMKELVAIWLETDCDAAEFYSNLRFPFLIGIAKAGIKTANAGIKKEANDE